MQLCSSARPKQRQGLDGTAPRLSSGRDYIPKATSRKILRTRREGFDREACLKGSMNELHWRSRLGIWSSRSVEYFDFIGRYHWGWK
jgi:hypothetical protein